MRAVESLDVSAEVSPVSQDFQHHQHHQNNRQRDNVADNIPIANVDEIENRLNAEPSRLSPCVRFVHADGTAWKNSASQASTKNHSSQGNRFVFFAGSAMAVPLPVAAAGVEEVSILVP